MGYSFAFAAVLAYVPGVGEEGERSKESLMGSRCKALVAQPVEVRHSGCPRLSPQRPRCLTLRHAAHLKGHGQGKERSREIEKEREKETEREKEVRREKKEVERKKEESDANKLSSEAEEGSRKVRA